jgi:hypothetical protein
MPFRQRGLALGRLWRQLGTAERERLTRRSRNTFVVKPMKKRKPQKPNAFARFVKANWQKVKHLPPTKRFKELGLRYRIAEVKAHRMGRTLDI